MVFDRAYVSNPLCTPSRATLFTGLTTPGHRVRNNGIPLSHDVPTMPEALRQAGYQTHYAGKPHLRTSLTPLGLPLDQVDPAEFPEARELWRTGRIKQLPTPYYGFEQVEFVNRHGHGSGGGSTSTGSNASTRTKPTSSTIACRSCRQVPLQTSTRLHISGRYPLRCIQ